MLDMMFHSLYGEEILQAQPLKDEELSENNTGDDSSSPSTTAHSQTTPPSLSGFSSSSSPTCTASSSDELPSISTVSRDVCPAVCSVCGDPATGYHYDAPSCNGCKTFFRRSILAARYYACKKEGKCMAAGKQVARQKCRRCRFDRCIEMGMNPLGIQSRDDLIGNQLVRDIVQRRQRSEQSLVMQPSTCSAQILSMEDSIERLVDSLMMLELAFDRFRKSTFRPNPHDSSLSLENLLASPCVIGVQLEEMPGWPLPYRPAPDFWRPLDDHAKYKIPFPDLSKNDDPSGGFPSNMKMWPLMNVISIIEYMKTFEVFLKLENRDKIILTKHVTKMATHLMSAFFSYSNKSDLTLNPDGSHTLHRPGAERSKHFVAVNRSIIASLIRLQPDRQEYVLLKAILICCDALSELSPSGRSLLSSARSRYANALLSYTMASRDIVRGAAAYADLLGMLDQLERVTRMDKDVHLLLHALGLFKHEMAPILQEVNED